MRVAVAEFSMTSPDRMEFEAVERKGLGHPDTLADLLAEEFSACYSRHGLAAYGFVPNHWVDKVALIGAASSVRFGGFEIRKPITAYLFGKLTPSVEGAHLPIHELFEKAVRTIAVAGTQRSDIVDHMDLVVENTAGTAPDHPAAFYRPSTVAEGRDLLGERRSNDTAFCTAYAPRTPLESLVTELEGYLTSARFRRDFPMLGTDVKVSALRVRGDIELTVCLPFHPERTPTRESYDECLAAAREKTRKFALSRLEERLEFRRMTLNVNTKDQVGGAYLTPFGTSLGKGDCGLVGRGNGYHGVVSVMRGRSAEAFAGKNPVHHVGKLYTAAAARIAEDIHVSLGLGNETIMVARNGDPLHDPLFIGVRLAGRATMRERVMIEEICGRVVTDLDRLSKWLLSTPAIDRFRAPKAFAVG